VKIRSSRVCVVGSINIDTTYRVPRIPAPGETLLAINKTISPGGKGANQAVAVASMDSDVVLLGCIGRDPEADLAIASLTRHRVDVSHLTTARDAPTGTAVVLVDDRGENVIVVDPGANQCIDPDLIAARLSSMSFDVVLSQLEINLSAVMSAARNSGSATFILNPAPMPDDTATLRELLGYTDVLVPNRTELARLSGQPLPTDRAGLDRCVDLLDFGGVVLVTLGSAGVAVYDRRSSNRPTYIDAVRVETVDTTGAGDTFCGVLGHFIAQHRDITEAARQANTMAALSTTVRGAQVPVDLFRRASLRRASAAPGPLTLPPHQT
jgi:ribokinase